MKQQIMPQCAFCEKSEADFSGDTRLLVCGVCKSVWYCGKPCQRKDWKEHKKSCRASTSSSTSTKENVKAPKQGSADGLTRPSATTGSTIVQEHSEAPRDSKEAEEAHAVDKETNIDWTELISNVFNLQEDLITEKQSADGPVNAVEQIHQEPAREAHKREAVEEWAGRRDGRWRADLPHIDSDAAYDELNASRVRRILSIGAEINQAVGARVNQAANEHAQVDDDPVDDIEVPHQKPAKESHEGEAVTELAGRQDGRWIAGFPKMDGEFDEIFGHLIELRIAQLHRTLLPRMNLAAGQNHNEGDDLSSET